MTSAHERDLLIEMFGNPVLGECESCEEQWIAVWEMGYLQFRSSRCALEGLPEKPNASFDEYLNDLRLKANVLDVFDAVAAESVPATPNEDVRG
jgi:hypothetical protein